MMNKKYKYIFLIIILIIIILLFLIFKGEFKMNKNNEKLEVISSAFNNEDYIPDKYTGYGIDVSIPLEIKNINSSGKSIIIIMDDPDAPTSKPFVHWLIWNIPANITNIPEAIPNSEKVNILNEAIQGKNDFKTIGYKGPIPPSGIHTYRINVYILDCFLKIDSNSTREELENAMKNHILQSSIIKGKVSHK